MVEEWIAGLNNNKEYMLMDAEHLGRLAHNKGINIKFIGRLALKTTYNYIREIACILVISRGIKRLILNAVSSIKDSQDPRDVILSYLNHLLSIVETPLSKKLWTQLTDYIQSHWALTVDKSILNKIHINSLAVATCKQLHINFHNLFDINYMSLVPFEKGNLIMLPIIHDETYAARSLDLLMCKSFELDKKGKRIHWNVKGGPEREMATKYVDKAVKVAAGIYQKNSLNYADTALEYAKHLESLHEEKGNPANSKWNKAAKIPPSRYSDNAEGYYELAMKIYEKEEMSHKKLIECMMGISRLSSVKSVRILHID